MSFNKALLDYIFKSKNDSPSVESSELIKELRQEKKAGIFNSNSYKDIAVQEFSTEFEINKIADLQNVTSDRIEEVRTLVQERVIDLRQRLESCKLNVKQALIAERSLIGESYTAIVPLQKEYASKNTTAVINDGIIFGSGFISEPSGTELLKLDTVYMSGQEDTEFKIISEQNKYPLKLKLKKNYYSNYQQIKINLPKITQSGILFIEFDSTETISILNKDGYEIISKYITDKVEFPVNSESRNFSLRLLDNSAREIKIKALYFTENIYNTQTTFETVPFTVDESLTFLSVQTCDNYTDKNINIKYEISINSEPYEEFRPNGKLKDSLRQSIIKTSKFNVENMLKISEPVLDGGVYKFYTEDLVSSEVKFKALSWKLGEDFQSIENFLEPKGAQFIYDENYRHLRTDGVSFLHKDKLLLTGKKDMIINMFLVIREEFDLILNDLMVLEIDGLKVSKETVPEGKYVLKRGVHNIKVSEALWKEVVDLNKYYIESIADGFITVVDKTTGEKLVEEFYYDPKENAFTSLYLQLFDKKVDVYLREEVLKRKYDKNYVEYFYKDDPYPIYILSEATAIQVESVQLRVTMNSLDEVTCPFISNITIRGI